VAVSAQVNAQKAIALKRIVHGFRQGALRLEVLRGASFELAAGEIVALVGPSGAGKSTLLHIAGLLERPQSGEIEIGGRLCNALSEAERARTRRGELGFVYQFHHLLPEFSALENVMLPQLIAGQGRGVARERGRELLGRLGLEARLDHRPARLSGGEQQRTAVARALANRPRVLLADEPTGNLDQRTADEVFAQLLELVRGEGLAALVATHNEALAARMDRVLQLRDGVIVDG
jgi:lipoprotein-releasing system ATP-binding protein